jgi:hypothetical protein
MNSVMDVPTFQVRTSAYAGAERRQVIRPLLAPQTNTKPKTSYSRQHLRQVALHFVCLLAAGVLLGQLCTYIESPHHAGTKPPAGNMMTAIYQWSGFHRAAAR